jgi:hypothetical protein
MGISNCRQWVILIVVGRVELNVPISDCPGVSGMWVLQEEKPRPILLGQSSGRSGLKPYFCTKSAGFNFFLQIGAVSTEEKRSKQYLSKQNNRSVESFI